MTTNTTNYTSVCSNSVSLDQCYVGQIDQALSNFNNAFQCYQQGCKNNCCGGAGVLKCNFYNVVQPAYNQLIGVINEVLDKTSPLNLPNYDASLNQLETSYQSLLALREMVDSKMKELNQTYTGKNGIPNLYKENLDVRIYTNTLWIILATSIVYFLFLQMKV